MQSRPGGVYVTYDIHDSRLVDKSNFSRDAFPVEEKKISSASAANYRESFKIQRKETSKTAVAGRVFVRHR